MPGLCAMAGKECPSCLGCAGTLHSCTPGFPAAGPLAGEYRIKNNEALRECVGLESRALFSATEIESGYACRHAVDAAEAQFEQRHKRPTSGREHLPLGLLGAVDRRLLRWPLSAGVVQR